MSATSTAATDPKREVTITRVFDAPRALVFKAWTQPEHLSRWWGPHGFTVQVCEMDLRVGGGWHIRMRSPQGVEDRGLDLGRSLGGSSHRSAPRSGR